MFYVYILRSLKDGQFYTGYTNELRKRCEQHNAGSVISTKKRLPLELIYYEACCNQGDAIKREKYLKSSWGKRYIKNRIKNYQTGQGEAATTEITRTKDAIGFEKNKEAAVEGGSVAGKARKDLEKKTSKRVSTRGNYLKKAQSKKRLQK